MAHFSASADNPFIRAAWPNCRVVFAPVNVRPTAALISGMYLAYNDVDTAKLFANRAVELGAGSEEEATKLADLLDRIEQPELFVRDVRKFFATVRR